MKDVNISKLKIHKENKIAIIFPEIGDLIYFNYEKE